MQSIRRQKPRSDESCPTPLPLQQSKLFSELHVAAPYCSMSVEDLTAETNSDCLVSYSHIALRFFMSSNLTVQGLMIQNSPQFNFRFDGCQGVHVQSLHITAPPLSPNTDGIHIENSKLRFHLQLRHLPRR